MHTGDAAPDLSSRDVAVTEAPFIRFYAGCPLSNLMETVGILSTLDTQPRALSDEQIAIFICRVELIRI